MNRRDLLANAIAAFATSVLRAPPQIEQAFFAYPVSLSLSRQFNVALEFGKIPKLGFPIRVVLLPAHKVEVVVQ